MTWGIIPQCSKHCICLHNSLIALNSFTSCHKATGSSSSTAGSPFTTCENIIMILSHSTFQQCFQQTTTQLLLTCKRSRSGRQSRAGGVLKSSLGFSGKEGREASNWVMWARSASLKYSKFCQISSASSLISSHNLQLSLPENVLVLDIARGQWGRALSIEQAWKGVGERDEEGKDVDLHEGRVHRLRLHQR